MNWDELGIAAAIGAAVMKVSEALVTYLSNRYLPSRRDKIEQEKQAFELYNDLIVKFNDLQKDLIQTREECYQKQLEMDARIAAMQTELDKCRAAETECIARVNNLLEKIKMYEQVMLKISAEVKNSTALNINKKSNESKNS
ncbi:MAG: hypothetical protein QXT25_03250 [Candidatus Anstonellaceae archaeon]